MASKNKNELAKGVLVYAIGTFGTKILSFLIVPLYTYYIATSDMGVYDVLMATIGLLTPLITLQISDAAYKWILQNDRVEDHIRATIHLLLINCALAFILILLVDRFKAIPYCYYFAIVLVLSRILETLQKLLRGLKDQKLFAISGIVYSVIFLSSNVLQIVRLKRGVTGLFSSAVIANSLTICFVLICEKRLRVNLFRRPDLKLIAKMLKFSIPLIPNYLNWWVINSSDKYIVGIFLGSSANGILAITHKFPTLLQTVLGLFNNSWQDVSIAEKRVDPEYNTKVFRALYRFAFGLLWPLIPATKVVIMWVMSPSYRSACNYVAFYYLGIVFQAFSSFYGVGYLKNDQTQKAFSTSVLGALVNALTNICMIRVIGLQAAAVSTFLGFLCMWLVRERQNRDELGIRLKWLEMSGYGACSLGIAIISIFLDVRMNIALLVVGTAMFVFANRTLLMKICRNGISRLRR